MGSPALVSVQLGFAKLGYELGFVLLSYALIGSVRSGYDAFRFAHVRFASFSYAAFLLFGGDDLPTEPSSPPVWHAFIFLSRSAREK